MYNFILRLIGCLKIEISGTQIEKFLNCAAKKKIPIRDLRYKNKTVTGNISPGCFLRLKNARKGIDVKIRIIKKGGIVFRIKPHRERVGFIVGFAVFLLILKFLSLFVWGVEIKGNKRVKSSEIAAVCESLGIKNGRLQSSLDPKTLADKLLLAEDRLTWASVNIEGCYVTINVSEAESTEEYTQKPPSNLIANESGTITKIDTVSGETVVSVGDNVAKGDILVSGIIEAKSSRAFVNSSGQIFAEVSKTYSESGERDEEKYVLTGEKTKKAVTFLWFRIPLFLGRENSAYKVNVKTHDLSFLGKKMPVSISKAKFSLYEKRRVRYSEETLKKILLNRIDKKIASEIKGKFEVVCLDVKTDGNKMTVSKTVKTTENIAKEVYIKIE